MASELDEVSHRPPPPGVGTVTHFRLGPLLIALGHAPCDCLHALVVRHEGAGKIALAIKTPRGWLVHRDVGYAPLAACDISGTWHPADEHRED